MDGIQENFGQASSVIAFTLRVDTLCTYNSANAETKAFSLLWKRSNSAVENSPLRPRGTRRSILPIRVIREVAALF